MPSINKHDTLGNINISHIPLLFDVCLNLLLLLGQENQTYKKILKTNIAQTIRAHTHKSFIS